MKLNTEQVTEQVIERVTEQKDKEMAVRLLGRGMPGLTICRQKNIPRQFESFRRSGPCGIFSQLKRFGLV